MVPPPWQSLGRIYCTTRSIQGMNEETISHVRDQLNTLRRQWRCTEIMPLQSLWKNWNCIACIHKKLGLHRMGCVSWNVHMTLNPVSRIFTAHTAYLYFGQNCTNWCLRTAHFRKMSCFATWIAFSFRCWTIRCICQVLIRATSVTSTLLLSRLTRFRFRSVFCS